MTFATILTTCYSRLGHPPSPEAGIVTRFKEFVNSVHKEVLADPILTKLRRKTVTVSTVANQSTAAFPQAATNIYTIVDRANQFELDEVDQAWIRRQDPGVTSVAANPMNYAVIGFEEPVARQPSASSQIYVKSSSASDTTQTAYIEVINSDGYIQVATAALNGTTGVALGPSDTVTILDFYLSAVAVGEVTLNEASGAGTELSKAGIGLTNPRYTVVELFPQPSAVLTLYADVDVFISDLVNPNDEPLVPDEFCEILVHGVRKREFNKREKVDLATAAWKDAAPLIARLQFKQHAKSGHSNQEREPRWSQLGPYYPPGS